MAISSRPGSVNPLFQVRHQARDGGVVVIARGEIDLATSPQLRDALLAPEARSASVVLDLREVTFFDSTGLQLVLDADVRAREEGRTFIVLPGEGEPRRVLELAEVTDRLNLEE